MELERRGTAGVPGRPWYPYPIKLQFTKMHGLGNDFVVIDGVDQNVRLNPERVRALADRRFGIGCDQVLLVEPPTDPQADFGYRVYSV